MISETGIYNCRQLNLQKGFGFSFFFFFLPHHAACRILAPQPGWNLHWLQWKHGALTTGPPGKLKMVLLYINPRSLGELFRILNKLNENSHFALST